MIYFGHGKGLVVDSRFDRLIDRMIAGIETKQAPLAVSAVFHPERTM